MLFTNKRPVSGNALAMGQPSDPTLDNNGTDLYFTFAGTNALDLGLATLSGTQFDNAGDVNALESMANDFDPTLTADGLRILFLSTRDAGKVSVYEATRTSRDRPFGVAVELAIGADIAYGIDITPDGLTLYYITGQYMLYSTSRDTLTGPFGNTSPVLATDIAWISVSGDQHELYYVHKVGVGVYRRMRTDSTSPFDVATEDMIDPSDCDPDLTPDGRSLVMNTGGNPPFELMVRSCP